MPFQPKDYVPNADDITEATEAIRSEWSDGEADRRVVMDPHFYVLAAAYNAPMGRARDVFVGQSNPVDFRRLRVL